MDSDPRSTDSLVRAGALIVYCTAHARQKGTSKDKCESGRFAVTIDFPGVPKSIVAEIERLSLAALSNTIDYRTQ
jgi:hypothetical protein